MVSSKIWEQCRSDLKSRLNPHNYDSWIAPVSLFMLKENSVTLEVPSAFFVEWIEEHYKEQIIAIFSERLNRDNIQLSFRVDSRKQTSAQSAPPRTPTVKSRESILAKSSLNDKHSFRNFVVGKSNEFCNASCKAVANNIGKMYNPLFIYGGVGLGKTHLLQAIGNQVLEKKPDANVLYITSEKFVNSLINSLQHNSMPGFRRKYRNLDLMLVDDIQFIGGKERTQEEFFHTFNSLFEMKKQIVVTSDKFPRDIRNLEERLRSRFAWGLIADIQPPELEIKIAILIKLARENGFTIDEEVAEFLADKIKSNIRELEGSLARVMAYASLTGRKIDVELVTETLRGIYDDTSKTITVRQIQKAVCDFYSLRISELKSKCRSRNIAMPRHVTMYLCREFTSMSLPEIGKAFGGRDHTTVLHSVSKIKGDVEVNTQLYNDIKEIKKALDL